MAKRTLGVLTVIEYPPGSDSYVLAEETQKHKKHRLNHTGGGVDEKDEETDNPYFSAAIREAKEESGLKVKLLGFLGLYDYEEDGKLQIAFAAEAIGGKIKPSANHPTVESYPFGVIEGILVPEGHLRCDRVYDAIQQYRREIFPLECVRSLGSVALPPRVDSRNEEPLLLAA